MEVNNDIGERGVKALLREGRDRFGTLIPTRLVPAFHIAELKRFRREIRAARHGIGAAVAGQSPAFGAVPQQVLLNLDNAARELRFAEPYCVCRGCAGEGCYRCGMLGYQTVLQYRRMPREFRA